MLTNFPSALTVQDEGCAPQENLPDFRDAVHPIPSPFPPYVANVTWQFLIVKNMSFVEQARHMDSEYLCNLKLCHWFSILFFALVCVFFAVPFSSDSDTRETQRRCCRQDTQAAMQLPGHKHLGPFTMHHYAGPRRWWVICVPGARETSAFCLGCCCWWAPTHVSPGALPGCESCARTIMVHAANTAPTYSRETSLVVSGPAVCPLAGSSVEVSNKEMASVLEPARSGCCTEI